jgi:sialate O-acetylesterase
LGLGYSVVLGGTLSRTLCVFHCTYLEGFIMKSIALRKAGVLAALMVAFVWSNAVRAEVKLPAVLNSHMVLQQGMPAPIWGWAEAGEKVTVSFAGQTKTTAADKDGKWQIKLDALKANAKGQSLTIAGTNKIELTDVLIGEVWICSGQSNMEWRITGALNPKEEVANSNHPQIRLFDVQGHVVNARPQENCKGVWAVCSPKTSGSFSAVGYYFGRALQKKLNVPIGLVGSNWGGTRIEPWVTLDGFKSIPELAKETKIVEDNRAKNGKVGGGTPGAICNAMIYPLAPFAMRGGIWYQGESNGNEGVTYYHKKKALINGWRKLFNPNLAFYWVQLADFRKATDDPKGGDGWARIREAQRKALDVPGTGMAVITDIGADRDIHPKNKQDVGGRLAAWALHQTYELSDVVPSGPMYKSIKVEKGAIRISFTKVSVGSGLMVGKKEGLKPTAQVTDGKLARFAISGADKVWHWADATIDGATVVVKSDKVAAPVAVRYAYSMNPKGANLYNKEGMPASPFRTDDGK